MSEYYILAVALGFAFMWWLTECKVSRLMKVLYEHKKEIASVRKKLDASLRERQDLLSKISMSRQGMKWDSIDLRFEERQRKARGRAEHERLSRRKDIVRIK
mgnify:CR=1 FL=1